MTLTDTSYQNSEFHLPPLKCPPQIQKSLRSLTGIVSRNTKTHTEDMQGAFGMTQYFRMTPNSQKICFRNWEGSCGRLGLSLLF